MFEDINQIGGNSNASELCGKEQKDHCNSIVSLRGLVRAGISGCLVFGTRATGCVEAEMIRTAMFNVRVAGGGLAVRVLCGRVRQF